MSSFSRDGKTVLLPEPKPRAYPDPQFVALNPIELRDKLDKHGVWLASNHREGERASFFSTSLSCADFDGVDLRFCSFVRADLRGACLRRSNLSCADFNGADLRYADLSGATAHKTSFVSSDCQEARFREADLRDAFFMYANLEAASFLAADLRSKHFCDNAARNADFRKARIDGLDLRSWFLSQPQLKEARGSGDTLLSDGLTFLSSMDPGVVLCWENGKLKRSIGSDTTS